MPGLVPAWRSTTPLSTVLKSVDYMRGKALPSPPPNANETATIAPAPPTKVGFVSLGCPKNLVDSEVMMGMLAQAGATLVSGAEEAEVIGVNTCSFLDSATTA